jgi:hypothetical protein
MPFTEGYPFERIGVAHSPQFTTRVWWRLRSDVLLPSGTVYQLQWGRTDNPNAGDWQDIGDPAADVCEIELEHDKLPSGMDPDLYFRVLLHGPSCVYASRPVSVNGELDDKQWALAREIVRKEHLRLTRLGRTGVLLKRRWRGPLCNNCVNTPTGQTENSRCPECFGTGIAGGYYPPTPIFCFELTPAQLPTQRGGANPPGQNQYITHSARLLGAPAISFEDVIVDLSSGLRYFVHDISVAADVRGVRLIVQAEVRQAALSESIYRVQTGGEVNDHPKTRLPDVGNGTIAVSHDYGGEDALAYIDATGCGIAGASVLVFNAADFNNELIEPTYAIAATATAANGRWENELKLNPGEYVVVFDKKGSYGPDILELTVAAPIVIPSEPVAPDDTIFQAPAIVSNKKLQPVDPNWRSKFGVY